MIKNVKWWLLIGSVVFLLISCTGKEVKVEKDPSSSTEQFVIEDLLNDKGLLRTDLTNQKDLFLSESVGFWLAYLLEKDDQVRFNEQINVMKSRMVTWRKPL